MVVKRTAMGKQMRPFSTMFSTSAWSPSFVLGLTPRGGFWKLCKWPWNAIYLMPCPTPCKLYIHFAFTYILPLIGPPSVVWSSELWTGSAFVHQRECVKCNGHRPSVSYVKWPLSCAMAVSKLSSPNQLSYSPGHLTFSSTAKGWGLWYYDLGDRAGRQPARLLFVGHFTAVGFGPVMIRDCGYCTLESAFYIRIREKRWFGLLEFRRCHVGEREGLASGQSPCTHRVMFHINVGCYGEPGPITIMSLIDL